MEGSPSSVLTQGLGAWGSVGLLLTLGFGANTAETGGGVCAETALTPRILATSTLTPRVRAKSELVPRADAASTLEVC